jgi:thiol-disulfide isomerase/thioredoxin
MTKLFFPLLLVMTFALIGAPQSGRRITNPPPVQPTPAIQPPLTPEPELSPSLRADPLFLSENLLERQIKSLDKGSFRLADFSGKVLVVNIWASWCGPCRHEVPEYEKVRKAYAGRDVEFIGLTPEDPRTSSDRVNKFARDLNFGFRLGWADRELARALMNGRNAVPQTLVIGIDGRIISHWTGYSLREGGDRLRQTIEGALSAAL